jgi:membrane protein implicated in regulation of membrane protease activity
MQLHHWWWLVALGLGVAELVSGTFYLLVLALGAASGGLAAWWGAEPSVQMLAAAVVVVAGWALLWRRTRRSGGATGTGAGEGAGGVRHERSMQLDVGEQLRIETWTERRRTQVQYRGARWDVELDENLDDHVAVAGIFVICGIAGIRLIVRPVEQSASR